MQIHLTETQPPRLIVTCADSGEFQEVLGSVDRLHGHIEGLEEDGLEPLISTERTQGLRSDMSSASDVPHSQEVVFDTHPDQQRTLRAATNIGLRILEDVCASQTSLVAGHQNEQAGTRTSVGMSALFGAIRAFKDRKIVLSRTAQVLVATTTDPV